MSIVATSASWGSFGSGVLRRDCRDSRADLIVRTGDHAEPRVSRQIAPCEEVRMLRAAGKKRLLTYSLAANVWMP